MNVHKNARLTFAGRREMVKDVVERRLTPCAAAVAYRVSVVTVGKWVGRYLAQGESALCDRCSRPCHSPRKITQDQALAIVQMRRAP